MLAGWGRETEWGGPGTVWKVERGGVYVVVEGKEVAEYFRKREKRKGRGRRRKDQVSPPPVAPPQGEEEEGFFRGAKFLGQLSLFLLFLLLSRETC